MKWDLFMAMAMPFFFGVFWERGDGPLGMPLWIALPCYGLLTFAFALRLWLRLQEADHAR